MKVYLACTTTDYISEKSGLGKIYKWEDINLLISYEYIKPSHIPVISKVGNFIIDSGIFSFLNGKDTSNIDWEEYSIKYADFVRTNNIKNYVEIDIDKQIGLQEVEKLRSKIEKRVGWKSMPVWHIDRGYDKWLQICRDYNYVCFGAFITDGLQKSKYSIISKFLYDAKKLNCKVHGLGFTSTKWLKKLSFYSVDSSTYIGGARYGLTYTFDSKLCEIRTENRKGKKIKREHLVQSKGNVSNLNNYNFGEWMKYAMWANRNLPE